MDFLTDPYIQPIIMYDFPTSFQVILFTGTIAHKRGEFFFDSRVVFESLFKTNFDPETALQQRTLYSIEEVTREIDFIAYNVSNFH